jgi:asparagine synthase (glutamine-hydrolysing)
MWDGRLDNREELIHFLGGEVSATSTDLEIVAAAYERCDTNLFARLIGDWALSIWEPRAQSLLLAKDFVGTRHLYYSIETDHIAWSTVLDLLVLLSDASKLNEEYLAGWFSFLPAAHLTPYENIHSVPPSSFVRLGPNRPQVQKYWDFGPCHKIRYRTDAEYEDHFRVVFWEAVRRRLRCDTPILAELSGGMDSSSIVCVADSIAASEGLTAPRIDTVSYYDDSEPNWNEMRYFSKVEEKRGRIGCHIDVSAMDCPSSGFNGGDFPVTPRSRTGMALEAARELTACMSSGGNRVVLSGIGGDEVTGGVPTPIPELQDLLASFQFARLATQLKLWALQKRRPWLRMLIEIVRPFLPLGLVGVAAPKQPPNWLTGQFTERHRAALEGYPRRVRFLGALPSFQENIATLELLRKQLACESVPTGPPCERRYPFLDRDFSEFIYAIPREQLVRPGQRRSLMRRALVGTVPEEILHRKRKAFVSRRPIAVLSEEYSRLLAGEAMVCASLGIIDDTRFREILQHVKQEMDVPAVMLIRTFEIEHWLREWRQWRDGRASNNCYRATDSAVPASAVATQTA